MPAPPLGHSTPCGQQGIWRPDANPNARGRITASGLAAISDRDLIMSEQHKERTAMNEENEGRPLVVSRRSFIRGAGAGIAGAAVLGGAAGALDPEHAAEAAPAAAGAPGGL